MNSIISFTTDDGIDCHGHLFVNSKAVHSNAIPGNVDDKISDSSNQNENAEAFAKYARRYIKEDKSKHCKLCRQVINQDWFLVCKGIFCSLKSKNVIQRFIKNA